MSNATTARQIAAPVRRLTVAEVTSIREGEGAVRGKDQENGHWQPHGANLYIVKIH